MVYQHIDYFAVYQHIDGRQHGCCSHKRAAAQHQLPAQLPGPCSRIWTPVFLVVDPLPRSADYHGEFDCIRDNRSRHYGCRRAADSAFVMWFLLGNQQSVNELKRLRGAPANSSFVAAVIDGSAAAVVLPLEVFAWFMLVAASGKMSSGPFCTCLAASCACCWL